MVLAVIFCFVAHSQRAASDSISESAMPDGRERSWWLSLYLLRPRQGVGGLAAVFVLGVVAGIKVTEETWPGVHGRAILSSMRAHTASNNMQVYHLLVHCQCIGN